MGFSHLSIKGVSGTAFNGQGVLYIGKENTGWLQWRIALFPLSVHFYLHGDSVSGEAEVKPDSLESGQVWLKRVFLSSLPNTPFSNIHIPQGSLSYQDGRLVDAFAPSGRLNAFGVEGYFEAEHLASGQGAGVFFQHGISQPFSRFSWSISHQELRYKAFGSWGEMEGDLPLPVLPK